MSFRWGGDVNDVPAHWLQAKPRYPKAKLAQTWDTGEMRKPT
jgi:hypothetical protein